MSGETATTSKTRKPVPRGIARSGPALLSYGFRPFFLGAGLYAVIAMALWIGALTQGWEIGGDYGMVNWHGHEMLFGYTSAALAGFMLTSIPNWTGRLPVSGPQLLGLVLLWVIGRIVMAVPSLLGLPGSALVDGLFLPVLALVAGIEIVAGKNWKNLKILAGLTALSVANAVYHFSVITDGAALEASRAGVAIYIMLIVVVGGRIVPSFTRNWLVKAGVTRLPSPFSRFDVGAISWLLVSLLLWVALPENPITAFAALAAAGLHAARLARWQGWRTCDEPLLLGLHVGYAFVPLGMATVALAAMNWVAAASALHVLTVGAIGVMTLAVMTRASLGHTGRRLTASLSTSLAYLILALSAVLRPFAELVPSAYHTLLGVSGACWLVAFGLYCCEYAPMLMSPRVKSA